MRLFLLSTLLTLSLLLAGKDSNSQNLDKVIISLNVKDATLKQVFNKIEKQTSFHFTYRSDDVRKIKAITYAYDNVSLAKALDDLLRNTGLRYEEMDKNILIMQKEKPISAAIANIQADTTIVSGKITNEKGEPLAGATVTIQGQNKSVTTNNEGEFRMTNTKPGKYTLTVSYVGYQALSREVIIPEEGTTGLTWSLEKLVGSMEEVVVVGYGTKKRQFLTGAVSTVGSEVLQSRPITNALQALQGEIPGTFIQRYSGQPGSEEYSLNVRGPSSISSTDGAIPSPLVLIDGLEGNLNLLNPADIESISVLKDAQASIYGARAAGGVFLVTTKKGKGGAAKITYNNNFAVTEMTGMMESPTNYQFAVMENEANIHNGAAPMYTAQMLQKILNNDPNPIPHPIYGGWMLFFTNTDWAKAILENGFQQKHNLSVSGSNANSSYYLSGGVSDQHGVVRYANDNNKLYNLRLNYDYNLNKRLRLESKVSLDDQHRSDIAGVGNWVIGEAIFGMPNHPVYASDGKFFAQGGWANAVAFAHEAPTSSFNTRIINVNFKLIADIFDGLKLNLQAGINHTSKNSTDMGKPVPLYKWDGTLAYYSIANPGQSWLEEKNSQNKYHNYTSYLQYAKKLGGLHDLDVMIGGSYEKNEFKDLTAGRYNIVSDDVWDLNLGVGDMYSKGGATHWAIGSLFSRVGYVYNDKYLFEANLRYDGSSRFQLSDTRWGLFPGVSVGWRLSKESFFRNIKGINELKLRASYGETGNQEGIGLYDFIQQISLGATPPYPFGSGRQDPSASLQGMVAYTRTWETLINKNIGVDAAILANKLTFSFDYFIKRNKNMLIPVTYPSLLGAVAASSNAGELKTRGFEATLGWNDRIGAVQYFARLIFSDAQNKVVHYGGEDNYVLGLNTLKNWWDPHIREGDPLDSYYGYVFDGIIRSQKELDDYKSMPGVPSDIGIGDAKFRDLNNDGKISLYSDQPGQDGDVKNLGSTSPRYSFGINLGAKVAGFDLGIFLQGVGKRTLLRTGDYSIPWTEWWRQPPAFYYGKTWNEDRPDAPYPRLTFGGIRWWNYQASTLQQINAAYIRLKNLQIGYTLPENIMRNVISRARIYVSGQDLWEAHHVKGGWDPESADWGGNYPFQRYYSFGIDITF